MKKRLPALLLSLVLLLSLCPWGAAVEETTPEATFLCSPWAEAEVARALELGIAPNHPEDLTAPITRAEFAQVAMDFSALQYRCPVEDFFKLSIAHYQKQDPNYVTLTSFEDCDLKTVSQARFLGIINGVGNNCFEPDRTINREEAAVLLLNTYRVYTGDLYAAESQVLPQAGALTYADQESIGSWAVDSVSLLGQWGVMKGLTETEFGPYHNYTWEQCIVTFLRLYDNAPASIGHGGKSLCPYPQKQLEQWVINQAVRHSLYTDLQTVETELGIIHFGAARGLPHGDAYYYFTIFYQDGGLWRYTDGTQYINYVHVQPPTYDHVALGESPDRLLGYDEEGNKLLELDLLKREVIWIHETELPPPYTPAH